jgi:uncharacterized protein (UPF0371 family)
MSIIGNFRTRRAVLRLTDEALHEEALREVESGIRRDGLWAKALSQAKMRESDVQSLYLEFRVQALRDELQLRDRVAEQVALRQRELNAEAQTHRRQLERAAREARRNRPVSGFRDWLNVLVGLAVVMAGVIALMAIVSSFR